MGTDRTEQYRIKQDRIRFRASGPMSGSWSGPIGQCQGQDHSQLVRASVRPGLRPGQDQGQVQDQAVQGQGQGANAMISVRHRPTRVILVFRSLNFFALSIDGDSHLTL